MTSFFLLIFCQCIPILQICLALPLRDPTASNAPPNQLTQPFDLRDGNNYYLHRIWSVSSKSPVSKRIHRNKFMRARTQPLYTLFTLIGDIYEKRLAEGHKEACNLQPNDRWVSRARNLAKVFQIANLPRDCAASINLNDAETDHEVPKGTLQNTIDALRVAQFTLFRAFNTSHFTTNGTWTFGRFKPSTRARRHETHRCSMRSASAYQVERIWYVRAAMTNFPAGAFIPDGFRYVAQEWVPQTSNQSLTTIQKRLSDGKLERSTTIVEVKPGKLRSSVISPSFHDPRSALVMAYKQSAVEGSIAANSVTGSNIAILALPMVMNFVPFSFIVEFDGHRAAMLVYVIFTDIFASIPFLVKGWELMAVTRPTKPIVKGFYTGNGSYGFSEVWVAECWGIGEYWVIGRNLVVIAVVCMLIGISIEIWALMLMNRRRREAKYMTDVYGPFGKVYLHHSNWDDGYEPTSWRAPLGTSVSSSELEGDVARDARVRKKKRRRRSSMVDDGMFLDEPECRLSYFG